MHKNDKDPQEEMVSQSQSQLLSLRNGDLVVCRDKLYMVVSAIPIWGTVVPRGELQRSCGLLDLSTGAKVLQYTIPRLLSKYALVNRFNQVQKWKRAQVRKSGSNKRITDFILTEIRVVRKDEYSMDITSRLLRDNMI